jgi:hypothetical protein
VIEEAGIAQLWGDLRYWELLDIQQSADEQLDYYYSRPGRTR